MAELLVAADRAPVTFVFGDDGQPVAQRGAGGMITIAGAVRARGATWFAAAMSEADRAVADKGGSQVNGLDLHLLPIAPEVYAEAYDVISNATLWFAHHGLFDVARMPVVDQKWWKAWEGFRAYNQTFTDAIADTAAEGGVVLVQDYHLCLVGAQLKAVRPDLRLVHFSHTPFATPDALQVLPDRVVEARSSRGWRASGPADSTPVDGPEASKPPTQRPSSVPLRLSLSPPSSRPPTTWPNWPRRPKAMKVTSGSTGSWPAAG